MSNRVFAVYQLESNGLWRATSIRLLRGANASAVNVGNTFASHDDARKAHFAAQPDIRSRQWNTTNLAHAAGDTNSQMGIEFTVPQMAFKPLASADRRNRIAVFIPETDGSWRSVLVTVVEDTAAAVTTATSTDAQGGLMHRLANLFATSDALTNRVFATMFISDHSFNIP